MRDIQCQHACAQNNFSNNIRLCGWEPHLVVVKQLGSLALGVRVHDLQQLASQLEGRSLKVDTARGVTEHEAKVDVDDVTPLI